MENLKHMSIEPEKLNQNLQDAVNNSIGVGFTNEDDLKLMIAANLLSNNHVLSKVRGEVIEEAEKHGQPMNAVLESSMVGQKIGFMSAVFFEGIKAGLIAYKYISTIEDGQPDASNGEASEVKLHAVDS
jgi:hypothetical protein